MKIPEGLSHLYPSGKVCKLVKFFYDLRQASRQWSPKLVEELLTQGYTNLKLL